MGRGSPGTRPLERAADPAVDRIFRLPLVPRHGPRVLRGPRYGSVDEPALRQHQGRPGRAAGYRPDIPDSAPVAAGATWWLAADDVSDTGRQAVLWRDVFSEDAAIPVAWL